MDYGMQVLREFSNCFSLSTDILFDIYPEYFMCRLCLLVCRFVIFDYIGLNATLFVCKLLPAKDVSL